VPDLVRPCPPAVAELFQAPHNLPAMTGWLSFVITSTLRSSSLHSYGLVLLPPPKGKTVPGSNRKRPDQAKRRAPIGLIRVHARRSSATVCFGRLRAVRLHPSQPMPGWPLCGWSGATLASFAVRQLGAIFSAAQLSWRVAVRATLTIARTERDQPGHVRNVDLPNCPGYERGAEKSPATRCYVDDRRDRTRTARADRASSPHSGHPGMGLVRMESDGA